MGDKIADLSARLTPRQREVLELQDNSLTVSEIANRLEVSQNYVRQTAMAARIRARHYQSIPDGTVADLGLSIKCERALIRSRITTIQELEQFVCGGGRLTDIRNIGPKGEMEIIKRLEEVKEAKTK